MTTTVVSPHAGTTSFAPPPDGGLELAAWTRQLRAPRPEDHRTRRMAHLGGVAAITSLVLYLTWRIGYTLPASGSSRSVAWLLIAFEALPLLGLVIRTASLWNIDTTTPPPAAHPPNGARVAVLIPTYNEPAEVIAPTIAAACALEPAHQTWVLDDGDRDWVRELCGAYGARYVRRDEHDHAKAGNMNHALDLIASEEAAGIGGIDIIAVLDCDHVPLPTFLTATLGWFEDEGVALVQGPQAFYNAGAFDDDGFAGEQGLFFNVLMTARHASGEGTFWCGSTSLIRVSALRDVGGVATETITEDMHTTMKLSRAGWKAAYHHQTLAVGLAPATAHQYLLQRRRWGMGAMQIFAHEKLWAAKAWLSWRAWYEYLNATLWWLEGIATLVAFAVPIAILLSGANTSTADPLLFAGVFSAMFVTRLWGMKRLMRKQIHFPTAFALRVFRVPVGIACLWWLVTRRTLTFEVTPKGGSHDRVRGEVPRILWGLTVFVALVAGYAAAGLAGLVPWRTDPGSTVSSGIWLLLASFVLFIGARRIRAAQFATSRRNAHRFRVSTSVEIDGTLGELVDISTGGAAVRFPKGTLPELGLVELTLPGSEPVKVLLSPLTRQTRNSQDYDYASVQVVREDWAAYAVMSLWMFHTPSGMVPGLPGGVPAVAIR
jgi:cellulose synthase (UDP-forming)